MRTLIVGDIHGCVEEFRELLDRAGLADDDAVIAVGDLVDRGPDPAGVVRFFRDCSRARSVMGNHERKHVRWARGEIRPALSQRITRIQMGDDTWREAIPWMERLPLYIELPECIIVHGFWEPGVPLAAQRETVLCGTMSGMLYIEDRYERPTGRRWYELYDGEKPLVVGHLDYTGTGEPLIYRDRVYAIDTGVATGGWLTGLVLPEFRIVRVRARRNHWREVRARHVPLLYISRKDEDLTWEEAEAVALGADRTDLPEDVRTRAARVRRTLTEAEHRIERLYAELTAECARILEELRGEHPDWDALDPRTQGNLFTQRVGVGERARLLHLARKGKLTVKYLRHRTGGPFRVDAYIRRRLGMRPDEEAFYRS